MKNHLEKIEQENKINIIYACEGGSRATGLSHEKSDYDVRFIYLHKKEWYLSIDEKKGTIEKSLPLHEFVGWDLKKALQLLRKSNPTLLEWLHSPIIYKENKIVMEKMQSLTREAFQPKTCLFHYINMAKKNLLAAEKSENEVKRFINIIRPTYAALWILHKKTFPPVQLENLIKQIEMPKPHVQTVLELKKLGKTTIDEDVKTSLKQFFAKEISDALQQAKQWPDEKKKITRALDQFFQETLEYIWQERSLLFAE